MADAGTKDPDKKDLDKKDPDKKDPDKKDPEVKAKSRTFEFTYGATVTGLKPEQEARIWLPVPATNEDQEVKIESQGAARRGQDRQGAAIRQHDPLRRGQGRQGGQHAARRSPTG